MDNICTFCSKSFSNKVNLLRHQSTTKSCLKQQGKDEVNIECSNCKKLLAVEYYKQHKVKCDQAVENSNKNKMYDVIQEKNITLETKNKKLKAELLETKKLLQEEAEKSKKYKAELEKVKIEAKESQLLLEKENEKLKMAVSLLECQNDKLYSKFNFT